MSYERNYTFLHNLNPLDQTPTGNYGQDSLGKSFFYQALNFLIASGWTCTGSSNATTVSSSNLFTSLSSVVYSNANGSGQTYSWASLKSPEGAVAGPDGSYLGEQSRIYLAIGLHYLGSYNLQLKLILDREPFLIAGTTTTMPTNTNAIVPSVAWFMPNNSNTGGKLFHFTSETRGGFALRMVRVASGIVEYTCRLSTIVDVPLKKATGLPHPYAINFWSRGGATTMVETTTEFCSTNNNYGWAMDGTPVRQYLCCLKSDTGAVIGEGTGAAGNEYNAENESSYITVCGHTALFGGSNKKGIHGRIPDMRITGAVVPQGSVDSVVDVNNAPNTKYCFVGCCHIPSNVVMTM